MDYPSLLPRILRIHDDDNDDDNDIGFKFPDPISSSLFQCQCNAVMTLDCCMPDSLLVTVSHDADN
jgi:hypothetical protein